MQIASSLYPPPSVANIFDNWLHGLVFLLGRKHMILFDPFGYVKIIRVLMIKFLLM
jgi:hypothetical protein